MSHDADGVLREFAVGRTDLVFEIVGAGLPPETVDPDGLSLIQRCAYHGDVSAIRFLLSQGARLETLGTNLDLNGASFHGHWRLCMFLIEQGAKVNYADAQNGETALHSALCTTDRTPHDQVVRVLLSSGANPNLATKNGEETGGFMRDVRTKGETPLHRAAAFGNEETIRMLVDHGAKVDARDSNGDSPLGWASWHLRPDSILRLLCFGEFRVREGRRSMRANLLGTPDGF